MKYFDPKAAASNQFDYFRAQLAEMYPDVYEDLGPDCYRSGDHEYHRDGSRILLMPDLTRTMARVIEDLFTWQHTPTCVNPTTGKLASSMFDVLGALEDPIPGYRCMGAWGLMRSLCVSPHVRSMFLVHGLARSGRPTPFIDLEAVESFAPVLDEDVFRYRRKRPVTVAVAAFKDFHGLT